MHLKKLGIQNVLPVQHAKNQLVRDHFMLKKVNHIVLKVILIYSDILDQFVNEKSIIYLIILYNSIFHRLSTTVSSEMHQLWFSY